MRPWQSSGFDVAHFPPHKLKFAIFLVAGFLLSLAVAACQDKSGGGASSSGNVTYKAAGKDISVAAWNSEVPTDILLILDQSGSMSRGKTPTDPGGLRVEGSRAFLEFVAGRSRSGLPNRFGVINFGTDAPLKFGAPLSRIGSIEDPSIKALAEQIKPLNLGDTSFIRALSIAVELFKEGGSLGKPGNKAIVIFTDGEPDDPRKLTISQYFDELKQFVDREIKPGKIDIFVIGIDAIGKKWSASSSYWKQIISETHIFTCSSMETLKEQFNRIVQRIWHLPETGSSVVSSNAPKEFEVEPYLAAVEFHLFPSRKGLAINIFRPNGKPVKPGEDPDAPAIVHLSSFDRLVVQEPEPGRWRYEVVGGDGKVEVLRNPIPIRMQLISPAPQHPQGKMMKITAEFKRMDGKPVLPHPDYPLALSAEIVGPAGQKIPIKFPIEKASDGVYIGEPAIEDTIVPGDYRIFLKVSGGGRFLNQQQIAVSVKPVPYLVIDEPKLLNPVPPDNKLHVKAQLLQGGIPFSPNKAFSNHPDHLVIAQVLQNPKGTRGKAVWLSAAGAPGQFEGIVPLPEAIEGLHVLAAKIAPEEEEKAKWADQTIVEFLAKKPPTPLWITAGLWTAGIVPLLFLVGWKIRRSYQSRVRLVFYYWTQGESTYKLVAFDSPTDSKLLPDLSIEATRKDGEKALTIKPVSETQLFKSDNQQVTIFEIRKAERMLVQTPGEPLKAVHLDLNQPPSQPEPAEEPPSSGGDDGEGPVQKNDEPGKSDDWGFGSTT
jgi:hypothetical protein